MQICKESGARDEVNICGPLPIRVSGALLSQPSMSAQRHTLISLAFSPSLPSPSLFFPRLFLSLQDVSQRMLYYFSSLLLVFL